MPTMPSTSKSQTPDERLVDPNASWVVSAGAGTGKTHRLVKRYIRCLESCRDAGAANPAKQVLAVTFTRAAAAEMRRRVLETLNDGELHPGRRALIEQLADASINTIHGFCATFLGEFPERSGVCPGVTPIDPQDDEVQREAFLQRFVDDALENTGRPLARDLTALLEDFTLDEVRTMLGIIAAAEDVGVNLDDEAAVAEARRPFLEALDDKARATEEAHVTHLSRVLRVGLAARRAYGESLAESAQMRFSDLETRALELLKACEAAPEDDAARRWLEGRYTHVLVDEYQDTSPIQVAIIERLVRQCAANGKTVSTYKVGDPKQSIYRFRGADVAVFEDTLSRAPEHERGAIVCTYRSAKPLADAFNVFFPGLFDSAGLPGDSDDGARVPWDSPIETHRGSSDLPGAPVTFLLGLLEKDAGSATGAADDEGSAGNTDDAEDDSAPEAQAEQVEAARVAAWIKAVLAEKTRFCAEKGQVAVELAPKDIAILLPKWADAENFRRALAALRVPATIDGGRGLKERPEIRDLANVIGFLADRRNVVAAAGVLRGALLGVTDMGLYALCFAEGVALKGVASPATAYPRDLHRVLRHGVLDAVQAGAWLIEKGMAPESARDALLLQLRADALALAIAMPRLASLFARAGNVPTATLLEEVIVLFRLHDVWTSQDDPARATANAWRFVDRVRSLESSGPDLSGVVGWLDGDDDATPEGLIEPSPSAVFITSIHKSKGLEWPIVVVAGLGKAGRHSDSALVRLTRVPHPSDRGKSLVVPSGACRAEGFRRTPDAVGKAVAEASKSLEQAEQKRLLYVAMTRAKDRLVLSGELALEKLLTKNTKTQAAATPGFEPLGWRKLAACSFLGQFLVSAARLVPHRETRSWGLGDQSRALGLTADLFHEEPCPVPLAVRSPESPSDPRARANFGLDEWPRFSGVSRGERKAVNPSKIRGGGAARFVERRERPDGEAVLTVARVLTELPKHPSGVTLWESSLGTLFHAAAELWGMKGAQPSATALLALARSQLPVNETFDVAWLATCLDRLGGSPLGKEMAAAAERGELLHEVPVEVALGPRGTKTTEQLLRGRIDVLFRDANGHWVVVDYKLTSKGPEDAIAEYAAQLRAYGDALEAANLTPVGRLGLWLATSAQAVWVVDDATDLRSREATQCP